jgi:hypothetical protein
VIVWSPVFVPETDAVLPTVKVFEVVPPAMVNPVVCGAKVKAFTLVGVIAPRPIVIDGEDVVLATEAVTP